MPIGTTHAKETCAGQVARHRDGGTSLLFSCGRRLAGLTNSGISTHCTRASLRSTPGGVMGGGVTLPGARYGPCGAIALHRALAQKKASARAAWRLLCRQIQPWQPQRQTSGPGDARHTFRWTGLICATSMKAPSAFPTPLGLDFPSKRHAAQKRFGRPESTDSKKRAFQPTGVRSDVNTPCTTSTMSPHMPLMCVWKPVGPSVVNAFAGRSCCIPYAGVVVLVPVAERAA